MAAIIRLLFIKLQNDLMHLPKLYMTKTKATFIGNTIFLSIHFLLFGFSSFFHRHISYGNHMVKIPSKDNSIKY